MLVLLAVSEHDISTHFSHCKSAQRLVLDLPDHGKQEEESDRCSSYSAASDDRELFVDTILKTDVPHHLLFSQHRLTSSQVNSCKRMYYQFKIPELNVNELNLAPLTISPKTTFLSFGARNPSVHILISVAVHGNEHCGVTAINQLLQEGWFELANKEKWIDLSSTTRITVLLGNPGAFVAKKRFLEENLNRVMSEEIFQTESTYERKLAKRLARAIRDADVYLDIHSTSSDSVPFALPAKNQKSEDLARLLPCEFTIKNLAHLTNPKATSMEYAYLYDKTAVCVECGQHDNPQSVDIAKDVIKQTILSQCSVIAPQEQEELQPLSQVSDLSQPFGMATTTTPASSSPSSTTKTEPTMELLTTRTCCSIDQSWPSPLLSPRTPRIPGSPSITELECHSCAIVRRGFRFLRKVRAFESVAYNEVIAEDEEGGELRCPYPAGAVVIMPTALPIEGEEAFFWGLKSQNDSPLLSCHRDEHNRTVLTCNKHQQQLQQHSTKTHTTSSTIGIIHSSHSLSHHNHHLHPNTNGNNNNNNNNNNNTSLTTNTPLIRITPANSSSLPSWKNQQQDSPSPSPLPTSS